MGKVKHWFATFQQQENLLRYGRVSQRRAEDEGVRNSRKLRGFFLSLREFTHQIFPHIQENVQDPSDLLQECSKQDANRFYHRHEQIGF